MRRFILCNMSATCRRCRIPRAACRRGLVPRKGVTTLPSLLRGQRGVPATMFRERALLHYPVRCADNRNVILSRRVCGASKNLLRLPRNDCNVIMPMLLYSVPPPLSFRPRREAGRRAERRNLPHCTHAFAMIIAHSYTLTLLQPRKILRLCASLFARHSAQDDRRKCSATGFRESGVRFLCFAR